MRVRFTRRIGHPAALALLALAVSGCGSYADYPPNLAFPSRTDRLVLKSPEATPTGLGEPGKIEEGIARLDGIGGKTVDPGTAPAEARAAIDRFLKETFGTPAASKIHSESDPGFGTAAERLALTPEKLTEGGKLFRTHCLKCHDIIGNGRGPAGLWLSPYPRDYRRGLFKFTTAGDSGKPRRSDLLRTISEGLKGAAMPSFGLLTQNERELLAGYVTFLAIRGQVEFETFASVLADGKTDVPAISSASVRAVLTEWEKAEAAPPFSSAPNDGKEGSAEYEAAVKRGYELFIQKGDNSCIKCHAEFGRKPLLRYDVWGTVAKPADLTALSRKGGAQPEDIFARIRGGIMAVGMPAHPELTDRQVWDLVRFVKSLPYQRELPADVRKAVYPDMGGTP